jgi:Immunity protein 53
MLAWLQDWYAEYCDGDWEHRYSIRIENLDNPGWLLHIDLEGTTWKGVPFAEVVRQNPADAED